MKNEKWDQILRNGVKKRSFEGNEALQASDGGEQLELWD